MKQLLTVLALLLFIVSQSFAQEGDWYSDDAGFIFPGFGTKHNPFEISSASALAFLADQVNKTDSESYEGVYFILTNDIDLSAHYWIPIGNDPLRPFRGMLDGKGKTVYNIYVRITEQKSYPVSGLFGHVGNGAKIENLTIEGGKITGCDLHSISRTGSLAGYLLCNVTKGEDSIIVRNCHNRNIEVTGGQSDYSNTGGLIGEGYAFCDSDGAVSILIEDCSNEGIVTAASSNFAYTGGIVGKGRGHGYCDGTVSAQGSFLIRSCTNRGSINGGKTNGADAVTSTGGIIGFGYASGDGYGNSDGSGVFTMGFCLNTGTVKGGDCTSENAYSYTGGIVGFSDGYGYGDTSNQNQQTAGSGYGSGVFTLTSCINRGTVIGGESEMRGTVSSTGGIFGFASGSGGGNKQGHGYAYGAFNLRNCYSYADISATNGCIGGLGGWIATSGKGPNYVITAIMQDSYVAGTINAGLSTQAATGGIIGRIHRSDDANKEPHIDRCLVSLSYIRGGSGKTYRIAGQLIEIESPVRVLTKNYAYIHEGRWVDKKSLQNGNEWSGILVAPPVSTWNSSDNAWIIRRSQSGYLPKLRLIPDQPDIPIP